MTGRRHKWRPSLGLVIGGTLAATLALSFAGLVALRYLGPEIGFRRTAVLLGILILAATAGLGWLLLRLLLRPIRALEGYATATERGVAVVSQPTHFGTRELNATAQRVIGMAQALRDREATIRSYTDHVTHELKSPVSVIRAAVELLEDGGQLSVEDAALARQIDGAGHQIEAQLAALRQSAQARETRYLGQSSLRQVVDELRSAFPGLTIVVSGADHLPLSSPGPAIILGHLIRNATDHGARRLSLTLQDAVGVPELKVSDDGNGIAAGDAGRIFEPFFTTRRDNGGTGMGLTIVRNLLAAHGAAISCLPAERGACFLIRFGKTQFD